MPRFFSVLLALALPAMAAGPTGEQLYLLNCAMCHQPTGLGAPPMYPPLAQSDFLKSNRAGAIRALCQGLSGPVTVNGQKYIGTMPAQMLDDEGVATVLSYVYSSWGNSGPAVTAKEVAGLRATTKFPTFAALQKASAYAPLPSAPAGWAVREVAQLPEFCTRLAGGSGSEIFVLAQSGTIYRLDRAGNTVTPIIPAADYLDPAQGGTSTSGLARDAEGRLWITSNRPVREDPQYQNEVTIFRTSAMVEGRPAKPKVWFRLRYPYGIGSFNHGVSHLAFGPDGQLYVSSGSRTDGGEPGRDPHYSKEGEVETTACLWRFDPKAEKPEIEVFCRGLRNVYGFAWDSAGRLFSVTNGPDANAPEEMDRLEAGRHYGFPFQFSDWPVEPGKPYPHTPAAPAGVKFTLPVANRGPAGGGVAKGLATFDAHSSPAGMIWCGEDYPALLRNGFLITRFGNLLGAPAAPQDVGFDVLFMTVEPQGEGWSGQCTQVLAQMGRPLDVLAAGGGAVLILDYTRPTSFKDQLAWLPGRVLELAPKK